MISFVQVGPLFNGSLHGARVVQLRLRGEIPLNLVTERLVKLIIMYIWVVASSAVILA